MAKIEVPQSYLMGGYDKDVLYTRGIATCIGLAVYIPEKKLGLLGHIMGSDDDSTERTIDKFIVEILPHVSGTPQVYIAQGFTSPDPAVQKRIYESRQYIEDAVQREFGDFDSTYSEEVGGFIDTMSLFCFSGQVQIKKGQLTMEQVEIMELETELMAELSR